MLDLNKNDLEALRILWQRGALKPAQIQADFSWPIENATLRSVLRVLVEKGHLVREKQGKAFYYRPTKARANIMSRMAKMMAQIFAEGSTAGLIAQLLKNENLSKQEIEELRRIASEKVSKAPSEKGANR